MPGSASEHAMTSAMALRPVAPASAPQACAPLRAASGPGRFRDLGPRAEGWFVW